MDSQDGCIGLNGVLSFPFPFFFPVSPYSFFSCVLFYSLFASDTPCCAHRELSWLGEPLELSVQRKGLCWCYRSFISGGGSGGRVELEKWWGERGGCSARLGIWNGALFLSSR